MSITRITGLASGLDVDSVVKNSMTPYTIKVDQAKQKQEILEIKQKLYRDVINSGNEFFNKYFDVLKDDSLLSSRSYATIGFDSSNSSVAKATGLAGAVKDNYAVTVTGLASAAKKTFSGAELSGEDIKIDYNGKSITITSDKFTAGMTDKDRAAIINKEIGTLGLKASTSDFTTGILIESKTTGALIGTEPNGFTVTIGATAPINSVNGTNLEATVTNSKGTVTYGGGSGLVSGSNVITLDGVEFSLNSVGTTTITGKTDTTATKEKIVKFVKDYNAYIEKLNTLVMDVHDKGYTPLTSEQKDAMSESEIKLWNEKVEKGQLSRDMDLSRIVDRLKSAMASTVSGAGAVLEKIGINPVKDYKSIKRGTFIIDESKLTAALAANPEGVMNLFIKSKPTDVALSEGAKFSETGIMNRMKEIFSNEITTSTTSAIIKRAGIEGSASFTQNTLSKSIADYKTKITQMQKMLAIREQGFYSKYAKLEVMMNKYNSQQSSLTSQLGQS